MLIKKFSFVVMGILIGIITGYLRTFSPMSFWTFSDLAARYGFWIFSVSLISIMANHKKDAFINSFLYMIFMCISYYLFLYFKNDIFYWKQFSMWLIFSIFAAFYGYLLNKNKYEKGNIFVCSMPIVLLGIELMDLLKIFINWHTNFMQLMIDLVGFIILFMMLIKDKDKNYVKIMVFLTFGMIAIVCVIFLILWSMA